MKTITIKSIITLFILGLFSGCCTIIHGVTQTIDITSQPVGAKIYIDGRDFGTTPISIPLNRQGRFLGESKSKKGYSLKIELEGYLPYEIKLNREMDKLFLVDIIGTTIGIILDAKNGAMYRLTPEQISATMGKKTSFNYTDSDKLYVAVTLNPDPLWERIGTLVKATK